MEGVRKSAMSFEELKSRLHQRLQNQGIFDEMRAQMRCKLVQELYQTLPNLSRDSPDGDENGMLPAQVSNWLVCDHLQREKYEFTLSTFLRESGMVKSPKKLLSTRDVLFLLGVSEHFTRDLNAMEHGGGQSFLFTVVKQAMATHVRNSKVTSGALTWREQLRLIDETFEKQKNVQTKGDTEYQKVMQEVEQLRNHIDLELKKLQVLESRSRQNSPRGEKFVESQVAGNSTVGELQSAGEDVLKKKDNLNQAMEHRLKEIEDNMMKKWVSKEQQLQEWEDQLRLKADRLEQEKIQKEGHVHESAAKLQEALLKIERLCNQRNMVQNENQSLKKILEDVSDYEILKSELALAKKEAKMCLDRLGSSQKEWIATKEELEATIAELTIRLSNPCSQLLKAHQEIKKLQDAYRLENSVWNKQQNDLEKEVQEIKQLYQRTLLRNEAQHHQLELQEHSIKSLKHQLQEVQLALVEKDHIIARTNNHPPGPGDVKQSKDSISGYFDSSPDYFMAHMLTETKKRIESMQVESDMLERRYRQIIDVQPPSFNPPRRMPFGLSPSAVYRPLDTYELQPFETEATSFDFSRQPFSSFDDTIRTSKTNRYENEFAGERVQENRRVVRRLESDLLRRDPKLRASLPILTESPSVDREQAHLLSGLYKPQSLSNLYSKHKSPIEDSLLTADQKSDKDTSNKHTGNGIPDVIISRTGHVQDLSLSKNGVKMSQSESDDARKNPYLGQDSSAVEHRPKLVKLTLPAHSAVMEKLQSRNSVDDPLSRKSTEIGSDANNATRSKIDAKVLLREELNRGQKLETKIATDIPTKTEPSINNASEVDVAKTENTVVEMAIVGGHIDEEVPKKDKELDIGDEDEPEAEFWKISVPTQQDLSGSDLEKSEHLADVEVSFYPKSFNQLDSVLLKSNYESDTILSQPEVSPQVQTSKQEKLDVSRTDRRDELVASQQFESQKASVFQDHVEKELSVQPLLLPTNKLDVAVANGSEKYQPKSFQPEQHSTPVPEKSSTDSTRGDIDKETSLVDDASDAELNISIGEQKTPSDDSFW